jgi:hypothetical protein
MSLEELKTLDAYLGRFGKTLGKKAIDSLDPLHVPGRDPLPSFSYIEEFDPKRMPFPAQQDVIAATVKMMDEAANGFVCGQMGTGKSLMGLLAVHEHALRSRRKGGSGGNYRAIVLCPDHLISKWAEELETTLKGVVVRQFDSWKDFMSLLDKRAGSEANGARWSSPLGAEWYIVGRNQAKWTPDRRGLGSKVRGFDGKFSENSSSKQVVIKHETMYDAETGSPIYDERGHNKRKAITDRHFFCPSCGEILRDNKGIALGAAQFAKWAKSGSDEGKCKGRYMIEVPADGRTKSGLDRRPVPQNATAIVGKVYKSPFGIEYLVRECGEPLWNFTGRPYRWPPATLIQKKMRRMFKYLIIDESHEQKSDDSAQSMAAGKLMSCVRHTLAMTGTLIGGYANHIFPLAMRMTPETLRAEGFQWGKDMPFMKKYGRVDRIVTTKSGGDGENDGRGVRSMRKVRGGTTTTRLSPRPGIMPTLFGHHLIGSSVFLTLRDLADDLPDLNENVEGIDMDPDVRSEYERIEGTLVNACKEMLQKGSMKLLGTTLHTTMDFPDGPFDKFWEPDWEDELAVGYYLLPRDKTQKNWIGVVQPSGFDQDRVYAKEKRLVELCTQNRAEGRQCWVYLNMTNKRNIQPRLQKILEDAGLRVGVLRADTVKPRVRRDWIEANALKYDVILSHPQLVSTGLDLFSKKQGGHNFSTLIFYETGYNTFTLVQAAARAWRIGQPLDCRVHYLYYKDSMQARAMQLVSRKLTAMDALGGDFSADGLAALAGDDNAQMAMAKCLSDKIDEADMQRTWTKIKSGSRKTSEGTPLRPVAASTPDPLDVLPIEVQLVAETILDVQEKSQEDVVAADPMNLPLSRAGTDQLMASILQPESQPESKPEPKPRRKPASAAATRDEPAVVLPMFTREQLATMFANLIKDGFTREDIQRVAKGR